MVCVGVSRWSAKDVRVHLVDVTYLVRSLLEV